MYTDQYEMSGVFDFLKKVSSGVNQAASAVIQGKQTYDAAKAAWKGVPYQFPAAPGSYPTNERFLPGTSQIAPPTNRALTRQEIADLQATLNALGHNTGAVDGIIGPNTRAGVASFQRAMSMTADGNPSLYLYQTAKSVAAQRSAAPVNFPSYAGSPQTTPAPAPTPAAQPSLAVAGLPSWTIPAAIGAAVLLLATQRRGR